jgi:GT2 family glycosyltransferase
LTVSVIVCVRNGAASISDQLAALAVQDYARDWELIVVDNGSTDGTVAVVEQLRPRLPSLRILPADERVGLAYARNVGARAARGKVLAFCDADDLADRGWLSALTEGARSAEIVGGRLDLELLNGELARRWRDLSENDLREPTALGYLPYAVGANFAVRRETFEGIGGCDERFTSCGDDIDLSWRIQRAGGTLRYQPDAVMYYRLRSDLWGVMRQRYRYGKVEALLRRKFAHAIPRMRWSSRLAMYRDLLIRTPLLLGGRRGAGRWLARASHYAGQLHGSLKYRVLA